MESIAGKTVANEFAIDFGASSTGMFKESLGVPIP